MITGVEVTPITELEEHWEDAVADAEVEPAPHADNDVAAYRWLRIVSDLAQTPAANMTDIAVKIGIAVRELRFHGGGRLIELLLESAEQDCLRIAAG